jgi:hypothetical protein
MRKHADKPTAKAEAEADKLLQELVHKLKPKCEICGEPTQTGHHLVEKSRSNRLRYEMENIVAVCKRCHFFIHNRAGKFQLNNSLRACRILMGVIKQRGGIKWLEKLERVGREVVKADILYYNSIIERLKDALQKFKNQEKETINWNGTG